MFGFQLHNCQDVSQTLLFCNLNGNLPSNIPSLSLSWHFTSFIFTCWFLFNRRDRFLSILILIFDDLHKKWHSIGTMLPTQLPFLFLIWELTQLNYYPLLMVSLLFLVPYCTGDAFLECFFLIFRGTYCFGNRLVLRHHLVQRKKSIFSVSFLLEKG